MSNKIKEWSIIIIIAALVFVSGCFVCGYTTNDTSQHPDTVDVTVIDKYVPYGGGHCIETNNGTYWVSSNKPYSEIIIGKSYRFTLGDGVHGREMLKYTLMGDIEGLNYD